MSDNCSSRIRVGVMGCSDFASRAMLPALREVPELQLVAVASRALEKAVIYASRFNCDALEGYGALLERADVDCVYMPIPTGLHPKWVAKVIESGKHLLVEKSFASTLDVARQLVQLARRHNRLVVENFLFPHHTQYSYIRETLERGDLGDIHLLRSSFSFPPLNPGNFRYDASLGGGALLDAGAYTIKFARLFLGEECKVISASRRMDASLGVDVSGTATVVNRKGQVAQLAYGFDSYYQCNWEFLGNRGKLICERAYTPPPGFTPLVRLEFQNRREEITLPADNHFIKMWRFVAQSIRSGESFEPFWMDLEQQAFYIDQVRLMACEL